jgi:hypothetical protein
MTNNIFDIVICVGPNDKNIITDTIEYTKKNIIGYRNIYLICYEPTIIIEGTITINEKIFPFTKEDIGNILGHNSRNGWYLQQLLKLYAGFVISDILDNYLVIDSDTYFLKPTKFISDNGKLIYTTGTEYCIPYFEHMNRLDSNLKKIHPLSGISHHCIFNKNIMSELFNRIENNFDNKFKFWELFLSNVDKNQVLGSGASEYEIYFTYINLYHFDKIIIRELNWMNSHRLVIDQNYDYISVHWYMRR